MSREAGNEAGVAWVGADGCPGGWVAVGVTTAGDLRSRVCPDVVALRAWAGAGALILIDIPIGLREDGSAGRDCDREARRLLRAPRAASVFTPPVRACLEEGNWAAANARSRRLTGRGLSRQAWNIARKIREVDGWLRADPERQRLLREAHPEVLFQALNDGAPMRHPKRRSAGRRERLAVLARHAPDAPAFFEGERAVLRRAGAMADDLLDAMVCALAPWASRGALATLPAEPEQDAAGLRMEIVYPLAAAVSG
ncbi:DUF429 domain-containing protein [Sediminicurvatus halobius]|uniref:DUF429 domain-containing protein n=1 Tax=Sediminicurvatus halobius TaxID=2182432 RepID=A0A2U2N3U5_9GAMM|nr:DUF429 domain-containing protein [Spiribacter halobius]PWG63895.1 DUF429 domain-containing protein [Spiribacter halobius]UEX76306.1 DUF429 domain-containing protein [Spiribacter halobius]